MNRFISALIAGAVILMFAASVQAAPGNLVLNVPDWNQPDNYPADGVPVGGYPQWCSPTAGGNLMGYWEDVVGCTGLTDRKVFNATTGYPGTPGTWQQGLYHDGIIEMGWHMDTGTWQSAPRPFPPLTGSTALANIGPGLVQYATTPWVDVGTGITKVAYPGTTWFMETSLGANPTPLATMWQTYCGEIDAARPVEATFYHWVDPTKWQGNVAIDNFPGLFAEEYLWDMATDPHSVVGVGYIDLNPGFQNDGIDEWFICQDGWPGPGGGAGGTGQYVAVPVDGMWWQNDYITAVPEPGTFVLLAMAGVSALLFVWRKRRTA